MGFLSTGDSYNYRTDKAFEGLKGIRKIVDDILVQDTDFHDHVLHVRDTLERCREIGITLNPTKFKFAQEKVKFAGYLISHGCIEADPEKLKGIAEFPIPRNRRELRSFMGAANSFRQFTPKIAEAEMPLRDLLKTRNEFLWMETHTKAFEAVKAALIEPPALATFDAKLDTRLETDASKLHGLGFVLMQRHGNA